MPCTDERCDPTLGCLTEVADCDDHQVCTFDTCDSLVGCVHTPLDCDDGDPCTADGCHWLEGCLNEPAKCVEVVDAGDTGRVDSSDAVGGDGIDGDAETGSGEGVTKSTGDGGCRQSSGSSTGLPLSLIALCVFLLVRRTRRRARGWRSALNSHDFTRK
jgi:hypothetical protein